jgi:non-ribosomal peptide synthetase component F
MAPAKFIRDNHLTMWFSVPSTIGLTQKFGLLRDGAFPSLRVSLFCGEALPAAYADAWHRAASSSVVENLYGPTEATISITHYTWDDDKSPGMCLNGIVPIGTTFEGQEICIIDSKRHVLPVGEMGELCLAGSQVTAGYWKTPKKTGEQYITIPSKGNSIWYRTGDLAKNDAEGCLYYLGRIDNQVKVRGYRVELGEVEYQVRQASDREEVVAIAWPTNDGSAQGIVAFIEGQCHLEKQSIIERCSEFLPDYMVPRNIYFLEALPRNANGKLDRRKLYSFLEKGD